MNSQPTARIFLIDDHPAMRVGLKHLIEIEPGLRVCGEIGQARGALEAIRECHPDIIILDLRLPDQPGLELIKDLRAQDVKVPILVISSWDERLYARRVLRAEANGYIMKEEADERIIEALVHILKGDVYLTPQMMQYQVNSMHRSKDAESMDTLTDRELQVLELIGLGQNTANISNILGISSKTVDAHRANIKVKLGIDDLHELIRFAVQLVDHCQLDTGLSQKV